MVVVGGGVGGDCWLMVAVLVVIVTVIVTVWLVFV